MRPLHRRTATACLAVGLLLGTFGAWAAVPLAPLLTEPPRMPDSTAAETRARVDFWVRRAARQPSDPIARLQAGNALTQLARETGEHALNRTAETYFRHTLALGADNYDALVGLSFALSAQHRFGEASAQAAAARDINPHARGAWAALGDAAIEIGDLDLAEHAYSILLADDRGVFSLMRQANLDFARGQDAAALTALDEADEVGTRRGLNPIEVARCLVLAGDAHFQRGRFAQAEVRYQRALSLWPGGYLPVEHLAELRGAQGRLRESRAFYQRIGNLAAHPDLAEAWGDIEAALGDKARAKALLDQALAGYRAAATVGDPSYYRHLALFLTDRQDAASEALPWAQREAAARPVPESWALLAWVQHRLGQREAALVTLDRALQRGLPLAPDTLIRGADILGDAGERLRARTLLEKARAFRGQHPDVARIDARLAALADHN